MGFSLDPLSSPCNLLFSKGGCRGWVFYSVPHGEAGLVTVIPYKPCLPSVS